MEQERAFQDSSESPLIFIFRAFLRQPMARLPSPSGCLLSASASWLLMWYWDISFDAPSCWLWRKLSVYDLSGGVWNIPSPEPFHGGRTRDSTACGPAEDRLICCRKNPGAGPAPSSSQHAWGLSRPDVQDTGVFRAWPLWMNHTWESTLAFPRFW